MKIIIKQSIIKERNSTFCQAQNFLRSEDENLCFLLISSYIFPTIPWYFPARPKIQ